MDSLQPLMTHRFWVCFAAAVVLIPVGWWMGSSSLGKEITKNQADIEAAEKGIPQGDNHPNNDWIKGLEKVVEKRKEFHGVHASELWDMQRSVMTWPPSIAPAMEGVKFFGPGNDENAPDTFRRVYYHDTIERLYKIVDPIGTNGSDVWLGYDPETRKVTGKVLFDYQTLPKVDLATWELRPPEWRDMWDAQLDAWLLEALLKSVKRVNERRSTKNIFDASIREIVSLMLRGGSPKTEKAASSETSPDGGKMSGMGKMGPQGDGAVGGLSGGGKGAGAMGAEGGVGGGTGGPLPINFLDNLFGLEVARDASSKDADAGGTKNQGPMPGPEDGKQMAAMRGMGRGGIGAGSKSNMSPYVDNNPEMPFKTRGFVLQVLMNRKDLPLLIQELTDAKKSRFPVEILLIHEVDRDIDHTGVAVLSRLGGAGGDGEFNGPADGGVRGIGGAGVGGIGVGGAGKGGVPPMPVLGGGGKGVIGGPPGMGPMGPMGGVGGDRGERDSTAPYAGALNDSGLGYVVIAGLMTIYQPPKEPAKKADATAETPAKPSGAKSAETKGKTVSGKLPASPKDKKAVGKSAKSGSIDPKSGAKPKTAPAGDPSKSAAPPAKSAVPDPKSAVPKSKPSGSATQGEPKTKPPANSKKATAAPGKS